MQMEVSTMMWHIEMGSRANAVDGAISQSCGFLGTRVHVGYTVNSSQGEKLVVFFFFVSMRT